MSEKRFKLSKKQYDHYTAARQRFIQAQSEYNAAQVNLATVSELVLDHFDIDEKVPARIDDTTKELVITESEEPDTKKPDAGTVSKPATPAE